MGKKYLFPLDGDKAAGGEFYLEPGTSSEVDNWKQFQEMRYPQFLKEEDTPP